MQQKSNQELLGLIRASLRLAEKYPLAPTLWLSQEMKRVWIGWRKYRSPYISLYLVPRDTERGWGSGDLITKPTKPGWLSRTPGWAFPAYF